MRGDGVGNPTEADIPFSTFPCKGVPGVEGACRSECVGPPGKGYPSRFREKVQGMRLQENAPLWYNIHGRISR